MSKSITYEKSKAFSVRIVRLCDYLKHTKKEYIMSMQLLRCGTSIGANIAEAECAISKKDFVAKMYIAFKECNETKYWLDILYETNYLSDKQFKSINKDCVELYKLLASITKSVQID